MKRHFFTSLALCGLILSANAQTFSAGGSDYTIDYTGANSSASTCYLNAAPSHGGIAVLGGGFTNNTTSPLIGGLKTTSGPLTLVSASALSTPAPEPSWFSLSTVSGSGTTAICKELNNLPEGVGGIDMSEDYKLTIKVKSDVAATLDVFVAAANANEFYPNIYGSTYNTLATTNNAIIKSIAVTTTFTTYTVDFSEVAADKNVFDAWIGRDRVNLIGFRTMTAGATFEINEVTLFGENVINPPFVTSTQSSVIPSTAKIGPNPSSSEINVTDMDVTSMKLMNMNGAVVREVSSSNISVEGLTSGIYFLQVNEYKPVKVMVK